MALRKSVRLFSSAGPDELNANGGSWVSIFYAVCVRFVFEIRICAPGFEIRVGWKFSFGKSNFTADIYTENSKIVYIDIMVKKSMWLLLWRQKSDDLNGNAHIEDWKFAWVVSTKLNYCNVNINYYFVLRKLFVLVPEYPSINLHGISQVYDKLCAVFCSPFQCIIILMDLVDRR